jgi:hypothetical protein
MIVGQLIMELIPAVILNIYARVHKKSTRTELKKLSPLLNLWVLMAGRVDYWPQVDAGV